VALAVVVTGVTVLGIVETLRYTSARPPSSGPSVGFFVPKSSTPVRFSLPTLVASGAGRKTSFSQLLGTPLVINMWASTCTVCTTETPAFERVDRTLGAQVRFVGIDTLDESRGAGLAFAKRYHVTYIQLYDSSGVVATGYDVVGLPVTVFVSAGGKVVGENVGALSDANLRHYLAVLFGVTN
jgi:thiol-disulfide isomerase/thioredoxin